MVTLVHAGWITALLLFWVSFCARPSLFIVAYQVTCLPTFLRRQNWGLTKKWLFLRSRPLDTIAHSVFLELSPAVMPWAPDFTDSSNSLTASASLAFVLKPQVLALFPLPRPRQLSRLVKSLADHTGQSLQ